MKVFVRLIIGLGVAFLLVLSGVAWSLGAKNAVDASPQLLTVQAGSGVSEIADELKERQLIRSALALKALARFTGTDIKTGLFYVSPSESPSEILGKLHEGVISEVSITFPEGLRAEEIAQKLIQNKLATSVDGFRTAAVVTADSPEWLITDFGLAVGDSLEGFLFPDTYRFAADATADAVIAKFLDNFRRKTADLNLTYDQLKLASIVEREALFDEDRPDVAGVYANRLRIGMKLDADPTVQYAKATNEWEALGDTCEVAAPRADSSEVKENAQNKKCDFDFWPKLTVRDYDLAESPYNTYRNPGLPPTPISNPGLASLKAAVSPNSHDYFYFLHDEDGRTHFAKDATEHNQNKTQYLR